MLASPDVNGDLFKLVLKAKTASVNNQTVSVNVIAKNGTNEILNITTTKSVKISCATHSYGNTYTKIDKLQHSCTCTDCGYVEKFNHTWNDGKVTKDPSEDETGIKTYTCTACGETKEDEIPRLTVKGVTLKTAPTKTEYIQGMESLDLTGGYLTVEYDNDTTRDVALSTLTATGFDNFVLGEQTVTVKYGDFPVSFKVTVVKRKISNVAFIMPNIKEYILGDTPSTAGGSVTVSYADGGSETKPLTLAMLSGYDMNKTGEQYVAITYEGYEGYFKISVFSAGDTNGDGVIGALDISFLRKMLLGSAAGNNLCDVNRDGKTDILDLIRIKKLATE